MCADWRQGLGRMSCILAVAFCAAALSLPASAPQSVAAAGSPIRNNPSALPTPPVRHATGLPATLESGLAQLVIAAEKTAKGEPSGAPQQLSVALVDGRVDVLVTCDETLVDDVAAALRLLDVEVGDIWRGELMCIAEPSTLGEVAALDGVISVRLPPRYFPCEVTTEALGLINADEWLGAGLDGAGVKVGVLDGGFAGYSGLRGTELPSSVSTYFPTGVGTSTHGTACAELIHDIAPAADLYFATFTNSVNWHSAVDWLIGQGVDVISCSMGWTGTGPRDGTSSICDPIEDASDEGILWVQSAGNDALNHWGGRFRDTNSNWWHEFSSSPAYDWNAVWLDAGTYVYICLTWDDSWGSASNDYDLYLYYGNETEPRAVSENDQSGAYPDPIEVIQGAAPVSGWYYVQVLEWATTSDRMLDLICRPDNGEALDIYTQAGSIHDEGTSPFCATVGAVDWASPGTLESFSSCGPTADGRTKPDLVGPDMVSSYTYGTEGFGGTSAATPHVAGAAALVKQAYPGYDADDIQSYLESHAVGLGASGKDNLYGSGRVLLPEPPPTLDFGDAPNTSYSTLLASNGARHFVVPGLRLGASIDKEYDGQPNTSASGDDLAGSDDEDGVVFLTDLMAGQEATVRVNCSQAARLDAWIDFNDDGDWADAGEKVFNSLSVLAGATDLVFSVPLTATATESTFARFRLSSAGGLNSYGLASDGEVEDYGVVILPAPPAPPTGLAGFAYHSSKVSLEWDPGLASNQTIVVRKTGRYPASIGDGTTVYSGSGSACTDTGLSAGTDYYYRAWSYATATHLYCVSPAQAMVTTLPAEADWTFMVYLDADNNLEDVVDLDIAEMESVGSTPEVNIIAQLDRYSEPGCWRQYVRDGESLTLATAPELNMADPENLADFVNWAATTYPAQHYALVIWNHGSGALGQPAPEGIIYDESHLDMLSVVELGQALSGTTPHVDLLGFDACVMQMYEVGYELSLIADPPDIMVGSEDNVPGYGWPYDAILSFLVAAPSSTAEALAAEMVAVYMAEYPSTWTLTLSGAELPPASALSSGIHNLAAALIASDYPSAVLDARAAAQRFSETDYRDLAHFCELVIAEVPDCATPAQAVKDLVTSMVLAEDHTTGTGVDDSHGLSIYLPDTPVEYDDRYDVLAVAADTWWDDFLKGGYDFGDAPDPTYATLLSSDGARHALGGPYLGATVDAEADGLPTAGAAGDDDSATDDEDGVTFAGALMPGEQVLLTVVASQAGILDAWVDFNNDGDWADPGEQVFLSQALSAGANDLEFAVPGDATLTVSTFARFRISSAGGLAPTGAAADGEVEDYKIAILNTVDLSVKAGWNMVSVPLELDPESSAPANVFPGSVAVYTWDPEQKSYYTPTTIEPECGYWVAMTRDDTITVTGTPVRDWTCHVCAGWNMVGSVHGASVAVADLTTDADPDPLLRNAIYRWNPSNKSYESVTDIQPGEGYWLATTADCLLTVSPPP